MRKVSARTKRLHGHIHRMEKRFWAQGNPISARTWRRYRVLNLRLGRRGRFVRDVEDLYRIVELGVGHKDWIAFSMRVWPYAPVAAAVYGQDDPTANYRKYMELRKPCYGPGKEKLPG